MCREEERRICGSGNGRGGDRMKAYTEKDLEWFERDDFGRLICPSGDYTQIKSFGDDCSAGCWFSDLSAFKERVRDVYAGTRHEKEYLAACDLAELMLMEEERCS